MKSMKKMLCLLLVAMLLVAAIPVAASAQEIVSVDEPVALTGAGENEPAAQQPAAPVAAPAAAAATAALKDVGQAEVNYTVLFAVENPDYTEVGNPNPQKWAVSTAIAVFSVASDANDDTIRAAGAGAAAAAGYSSVTADAIVSRVSANGGAALVHNVRYGTIKTVIDTTYKQFKYVLEVSARPAETTWEETRDAKILLDKENTGKYEEAGTVPVTLVASKYGTTVTYSLKSNGGATVDDIKGVLGANYKNKTLSMTVQGPSANGEVTYRVTVKGNSGSTGTNIPTYDGTNSNNGGIVTEGGSTNNGGSGSNTTNLTFPDYATFKINGQVVYGKWVHNQRELDAARAEAVSIMRNMGYKVSSWNVKQTNN